MKVDPGTLPPEVREALEQLHAHVAVEGAEKDRDPIRLLAMIAVELERLNRTLDTIFRVQAPVYYFPAEGTNKKALVSAMRKISNRQPGQVIELDREEYMAVQKLRRV